MVLVSAEKIEAYTSRGWWGAKTLWDCFVANVGQWGGREAVVDAPNRAEFTHGAPRRLSWSQLADEVDRFCVVQMANNFGINPGDRREFARPIVLAMRPGDPSRRVRLPFRRPAKTELVRNAFHACIV